LGSEPEIYFYADRHSATGYIYNFALQEKQKFAEQMQQEMFKEIEAGRPDILVVDLRLWVQKNSIGEAERLAWVRKFIRDYRVIGILQHKEEGSELHWGYFAPEHDPEGTVMYVLRRKEG